MSNYYLKLNHEVMHCEWLSGSPPSNGAAPSYDDFMAQQLRVRSENQLKFQGREYSAEEVTIAPNVSLWTIMKSPSDEAVAAEMKILDAFNLANQVFNICKTQGELCMQGVKFLKDILHVDRAGVLLLSPNGDEILGTWGTNEQGDIVEEADLRLPLSANLWMQESLERREQLIINENVELLNYGRKVGTGWNAIVSIYQGASPVGWLCCDNLLSGSELTPELRSQISHFGSMLGQWMIRVRNETELRHLNENLEQEVLQKTQDLQVSFRQLQKTQTELVQTERTKALSTFTAGVAHEINNPIGFIRSNLSFIGKVSTKAIDSMREIANDELAKSIVMLEGIDQVIDESVEGLDRVSNIISMLQPLNKLADEEPQEFDLIQAIEFALMGLPEHTLSVNLISELKTLMVNLPMQIFTLALENVMENALTAAENSENGKVEVNVRIEGSDLVVSCQDNGTGISAANIESIFLPFFTTRAPGEGLGLGLSLAQNLVQLANGHMDVQSKEGHGTTMNIRFNQGVVVDA